MSSKELEFTGAIEPVRRYQPDSGIHERQVSLATSVPINESTIDSLR